LNDNDFGNKKEVPNSQRVELTSPSGTKYSSLHGNESSPQHKISTSKHPIQNSIEKNDSSQLDYPHSRNRIQCVSKEIFTHQQLSKTFNVAAQSSKSTNPACQEIFQSKTKRKFFPKN
jgi:hypothetical protein